MQQQPHAVSQGLAAAAAAAAAAPDDGQMAQQLAQDLWSVLCQPQLLLQQQVLQQVASILTNQQQQQKRRHLDGLEDAPPSVLQLLQQQGHAAGWFLLLCQPDTSLATTVSPARCYQQQITLL
jgi:hypothetical protein